MNTQVKTLSFQACCRIILDSKVNDQAKSYANAGLRLVGQGAKEDSELIRTQVLYILTNLASWRGLEARMIKTSLRALTERKKT